MPEGYVHPEYLVETDWLAAHLGDPKLVILDGTVHLIPDPKITYVAKPGSEDFDKGHIPGAHISDPVEMPYAHLRKGVRLRPLGPVRQ